MTIRGTRARLLAALLLSGAVLAAGGPAAVHPAAAPVAPGPPAGWVAPGVPADPASAPGAAVETITLGAAPCAALNATDPGVAPTCQLRHYSGGVNHQPVPGSPSRGGVTNGAYWSWYWSHWDAVCGAWCSWKMASSEDGVADGYNVWQWDHGCTPSGYGTVITWCGSLYNGGGWPNYAMQFGLNGNVCAGPNIGCVGHGLRRWIDDNGKPGGFYTW